ncbi:hypothetical protein JYK21_03775 [Ralstonia pickettii]|nr:hypothetical protein [Ralstonia pickettii]
MKLTVVGDFKAGKELMKLYRAEAVKEINKIERKRQYSSNDISRLYKLEKQRLFYSVSKTLPARVEGIVINVKLLQSFIRKLGSKYDYSIKVEDKNLILNYKSRSGKGQGSFTLYDISEAFKNFTNIPKLEFPEGG